MKKLLRFDWDVIAGILAAVVAIAPHLLHIAHADVLLPIILVMLALLLLRDLRDLRHEGPLAQIRESLDQTSSSVTAVRDALQPPDAMLIGPRRLRAVTARFFQSAQGTTDIEATIVALEMAARSRFDLHKRLAGAEGRAT